MSMISFSIDSCSSVLEDVVALDGQNFGDCVGAEGKSKWEHPELICSPIPAESERRHEVLPEDYSANRGKGLHLKIPFLNTLIQFPQVEDWSESPGLLWYDEKVAVEAGIPCLELFDCDLRKQGCDFLRQDGMSGSVNFSFAAAPPSVFDGEASSSNLSSLFVEAVQAWMVEGYPSGADLQKYFVSSPPKPSQFVPFYGMGSGTPSRQWRPPTGDPSVGSTETLFSDHSLSHENLTAGSDFWVWQSVLQLPRFAPEQVCCWYRSVYRTAGAQERAYGFEIASLASCWK
ncbi:hypothetical protein AYI70_g1640 [Smittium culicis]|uniref:Uncharacterized protein n=1 Tax=Smittium culicis TaxID=133412 RepID=A0A1R1YBS4_9FUNG|nr:hypothetical protein AYI70_g1640 [Smittium culicis]